MLLLLAAGCVTAAGSAGARLKTPAWTDGYGSATRAVCVNGGSVSSPGFKFQVFKVWIAPPWRPEEGWICIYNLSQRRSVYDTRLLRPQAV